MNGIFLSVNSLSANLYGSVSPCSGTTIGGAFLESCNARVPRTLARSYLVKKFDVMRLVLFTAFFFFLPGPPIN